MDKLSIIEFADTTAQLNALLGGAVDYCQMIPGAQRKIAEGAGIKLLEAKTGSWIPFTMNVPTSSRSTTCACARPSASSSTARR